MQINSEDRVSKEITCDRKKKEKAVPLRFVFQSEKHVSNTCIFICTNYEAFQDSEQDIQTRIGVPHDGIICSRMCVVHLRHNNVISRGE